MLTWGSANPVTCRLVASITREMTWEVGLGFVVAAVNGKEGKSVKREREWGQGGKKKKEKREIKKSTVGAVLRAGTRVLGLNWSIGSDSIQFTANQIQ